mmetsp:Transcript_25507/g.40271  ORF Transcript_25507/g.40271 Transcript_25507/m.40271 type:complete len:223 (-) Transcript_25507:36-704(-)
MDSFDIQVLSTALRHACSLYPPPSFSSLCPFPPAFNIQYPGIPEYPREETRVDPKDGRRYTCAQFSAYYGGLKEWREAASSSDAASLPERRVDPADGKEYTKTQFKAYYGQLAEWEAADPNAPNRLDTEEGELGLSEELLRVLYNQRKKRLFEKEQRKREAKKKEEQNQVLKARAEAEAKLALNVRSTTQIQMLESELDARYESATDAVGYPVHPWPIEPLR